MREAELIDPSWQEAIDLLITGKSVFISVPDYYGGQRFMDTIRQSDELNNSFTVVNLHYFNDSIKIDFQKIIDNFQQGESDRIQLPENNKFDFAETIRKLVLKKPFLVLITSTYHSFNNVSTLVDSFHDIIKYFPNDRRKYLSILLMDDYSMYFHENKRTYSYASSAWNFFARFHIAPLCDSRLVDKYLIDFFHHGELVKRISSALFRISGGHQGLISDALKYIFNKWELIDFNNVEQEVESIISKTHSYQAIGKEYSSLSSPDLQSLYSFRHKRLFEVNETDLVKRFFTKGVLANSGDLHVVVIKGVVRKLLENMIDGNMTAPKKLALCIHGLDGSDLTWRRFKEIYDNDEELKAEYDFAMYTFPTTKYWNLNFFKASDPPIQQLAKGLETEIEYKYFKYSAIVLVCHSLGGLVGRKFLLDRFLININQPQVQYAPIIRKIVMYATPHNGANLANLVKHITIRNKQIIQLARKSDFLDSLNENWMKTGAHDYYKGWYVVGGKDQIVDKDSAGLFWGNNRCKTIISADHFSIIKPENEEAVSYLIFRKTLLE
ncbi:hypothetical protein DYBT9275_03860 [Dyadobacter sp. CECT 9275]|uniref:DUF676 domain-containing protein n=1 Tax=Dyadobacter helix TaxID=2822344 RepID=A0A916JES8_9BACT|nr:hypothetical protein [Dyadobacter sp. CECT 9275]CAG5006601.1 hypothetical protein DYBT9275_03860 [Dyadobacter sp. CECT 9275]